MTAPVFQQLVFQELAEIVPSAIGMLGLATDAEVVALGAILEDLVRAVAYAATTRGFDAASAIAAADAAAKLALHLRFEPKAKP